jgi:hypothetical protein
MEAKPVHEVYPLRVYENKSTETVAQDGTFFFYGAAHLLHFR